MFFVFGPLSQLFNFIQCITTTILTQWLFSTAAWTAGCFRGRYFTYI